jgi:hypothetical protein
MIEPSLALDRAAAGFLPTYARPSSVTYSQNNVCVQILMRLPWVQTYPEYRAYARVTKRMIPYVF